MWETFAILLVAGYTAWTFLTVHREVRRNGYIYRRLQQSCDWCGHRWDEHVHHEGCSRHYYTRRPCPCDRVVKIDGKPIL